MVRIGRLAFRVRSISTESYTSDDIISEGNSGIDLEIKNAKRKKKKSSDSFEEILDKQYEKEKGATCRICLGEEEDGPDG